MAFRNDRGRGFLFSSNKLLEMSATNFSIDDFDVDPKHDFEVSMKNFVEINVDYMQMGVGGDNSWGYRPHKEYRLLEKNYSYTFTISPLEGETKTDDIFEIAKGM
jgi:beta-galactosidase